MRKKYRYSLETVRKRRLENIAKSKKRLSSVDDDLASMRSLDKEKRNQTFMTDFFQVRPKKRQKNDFQSFTLTRSSKRKLGKNYQNPTKNLEKKSKKQKIANKHMTTFQILSNDIFVFSEPDKN